jgi:uncharacterized protein (DUF983 family)
MPRTIDDEDDDFDDNDDDDTIPCPHCKKQIYDGAEQCPNCGYYISEEDAPREAKPVWIVIGGILCLAVMIMWLWRG